MKKSSKELLFERMHYVAGMPLKKLNEDEMTQDDIADAAEDSGEESYAESPMYQVKLDKISKCASEIHDKISDFENLPAWVQDKITIAEHNMCAIQDWLDGKAHDEKYQEEEQDEEAPEEESSDEELEDDKEEVESEEDSDDKSDEVKPSRMFGDKVDDDDDDVKISDDDLDELS